MPSFLPRKANPKLTDMVASEKARHERDQAMFDKMLDECVSLEEAWIEIKLANLPSAKRNG